VLEMHRLFNRLNIFDLRHPVKPRPPGGYPEAAMLRGVVEMIPAQQEKGCFTHVVYRVLA